jgi:hypothetical protein
MTLARTIGAEGRFERGPLMASYSRPFVVRDGNLVTARWPGDAVGFAQALVSMLFENKEENKETLANEPNLQQALNKH